MSLSKSKKIAFVGAGYMTMEHLKAFNDIDGVLCVGITSRTKARAEQLAEAHGVEFTFDSIAEMYEKTHADAVVISVPELSLNEVAFEAFKFPWKILIEKPVGYNLEDSKNILEEAQRTNSEVFVALNRRHYCSTEFINEELKEQNGNRLITIYDQQDPNAALAAGQPKLVVDNWMFANSIHVIDLFNLFARGHVSKVEHLIPWKEKDPFLVLTKLEFDSGDIGIYQAVWNGPGPWSVSICTPNKRFEMRPLERATFQNKGDRAVSDFPIHAWDKDFKPGLRKQAQRFFDFINSGNNIGLPTLEESFSTMELIQKIYS
uniref:Gfo/Idh/MocA family protein n=1 Tax=Algoriphagus sp. TaxID=1872435 RepID=UPI004047C966